jgi:hypothetical protein
MILERYNKTDELTLYTVFEDRLELIGPAIMDHVYISTTPKSCGDLKSDLHSIEDLFQKALDATGGDLTLSDACAEMGDRQKHFDQNQEKRTYPGGYLGMYIEEFIYSDIQHYYKYDDKRVFT